MEFQGARFVLLLVGVICVGILLSAIFIPGEISDAERSRIRVARGLLFANTAKTAIADYYKQHQIWPANNAALDLPEPGALVSDDVKSIAVGQHGVIIVTFNDALPSIADYQIALTPTIAPTGIEWSCRSVEQGPEKLDSQWLPPNCR